MKTFQLLAIVCSLFVFAGTAQLKVVITNDLDQKWSGRVRLRLLQGDRELLSQEKPASAEAYGQAEVEFKIKFPDEPGGYQLVAERINPGEEIASSRRSLSVVK